MNVIAAGARDGPEVGQSNFQENLLPSSVKFVKLGSFQFAVAVPASASEAETFGVDSDQSEVWQRSATEAHLVHCPAYVVKSYVLRFLAGERTIAEGY